MLLYWITEYIRSESSQQSFLWHFKHEIITLTLELSMSNPQKCNGLDEVPTIQIYYGHDMYT